ncbi:MAG: GAF domain-containing protein [Candidatus Thorarchaeota archaeon]|nr:GAF domain-containing protein [Candidatus Thorarchaeota archaeon]NIW14243.1 GAF domain-containing protein [Candidatus Thorarchaeota archaeon]NIW52335.1 GAF domain-containing protein [Candidatus Korarchaeota archaeon]
MCISYRRLRITKKDLFNWKVVASIVFWLINIFLQILLQMPLSLLPKLIPFFLSNLSGRVITNAHTGGNMVFSGFIFVIGFSKIENFENTLNTLHSWAQKSAQAKKKEDVYTYTLDALESIVTFDNAFLGVKKRNSLQVVQTRGYTLPKKYQRVSLDGKDIPIKAVSNGETMLVTDIKKHPSTRQLAPEITSMMAVPLKLHNEVIGVLTIGKVEENGFDQYDALLMETLASLFAVMIKKLQIDEQLEKVKVQHEELQTTLQKLSELRKRFISRTTQELGNPLSSIKTKIESLLQGYHGPITEEQGDQFNDIVESVDLLSQMVQDFRRISKILTFGIELEKKKCRLADTIEVALGRYETALMDEDILVIKHIEKPLHVRCDERQILKVLRNLIENAIDYTEDTIWIRGWTKEGMVWISIEDNGLGIPEKHHKKIFDPFYVIRGEKYQMTRRYEGTGLGLAVCKQIIEAHNGNIHIDSEPSEGTSFKISIPKQSKEETPAC